MSFDPRFVTVQSLRGEATIEECWGNVCEGFSLLLLIGFHEGSDKCGLYHSWTNGLGYLKKLAKHEPESSIPRVSGPGSCLAFLS